jgi:hypothetical protein
MGGIVVGESIHFHLLDEFCVDGNKRILWREIGQIKNGILEENEWHRQGN